MDGSEATSGDHGEAVVSAWALAALFSTAWIAVLAMVLR